MQEHTCRGLGWGVFLKKQGKSKMTALVIIDMYPKNPQKLNTYISLAGNTLIPFGGKLLVKSAIQALHGESGFLAKAVVEFPSRDCAVKWYKSDAYQEIIPIRDEAMESRFHLVG